MAQPPNPNPNVPMIDPQNPTLAEIQLARRNVPGTHTRGVDGQFSRVVQGGNPVPMTAAEVTNALLDGMANGQLNYQAPMQMATVMAAFQLLNVYYDGPNNAVPSKLQKETMAQRLKSVRSSLERAMGRLNAQRQQGQIVVSN